MDTRLSLGVESPPTRLANDLRAQHNSPHTHTHLAGYWPYGWKMCNIWVTCDVLTSSSSIMHMCFISVGRYLGIRNPLHARHTNLLVSRRAVLCRIALAWLIATLIASPITMMALYDHRNIVPNARECGISNEYFMIFGESAA